MSIYPNPDKLDNLESKYTLVIMAAKRARQLKDGARRLIETRSTNPLTIALEEIAAGAIVPRMIEDETVAAQQAELKPHEPTLEDIIGAGPVLVMEPEAERTAAQLAALRSAEPDHEEEEEEAPEEAEDVFHALDAFPLASPALMDDEEEEEELEAGLTEEEEEE
ncbi:MAG TPA: DNA-directed RNA polymerase subunit omega [Chthonomonadaceae bacterium]|nr:DNA-directed RNA polymerase subunit omega [Chthonomonadaceae bacterium]